MRRAAIGLAVMAAALAAAAPASAVTPDRSFTLGADPAKYEWDGGPGFGILLDGAVADKVGCNAAVHTCDYTLLNATQAGDLLFSTSSADKNNVDMDVHFYTSDADGTVGDQWDEATSFSPNETLAETLDPGYYLVEIDYLTSVAGTYHGTVEFAPATP
jgi:hypothetical protein